MKAVLKSALVGVAGTGVFFFFLMAGTVLVLAVRARFTSVPVDSSSVVVAPTAFLRHVGLPLSAVVFAVVFGLAMKKFRRGAISRQPSAVGKS